MDYLAKFDMPWEDDYVQMRLRAPNIHGARNQALKYAYKIAEDLCGDASADIKIMIKEA